jgi:hypothetical protein
MHSHQCCLSALPRNVVQNTSDKKCSIVAEKDKPAKDDKTMVVIGTKNYQTMEEAEAKMKTEKDCLAQ